VASASSARVHYDSLVNLLVFGASGQCGRWVVGTAHARGWRVTALVRDTTSYDAPAGVSVVRGDVLNAATVSRVMPGHDAILSCLGAQRVNPRNPWSPLRSPPDFARRSAEVIIGAAQASGVQRIGTISAAGVGDSIGTLNAPMRWLLEHSTIGTMYADLGAMENCYRDSDLDWFAVRPVTLIDAAPSRRTRELQRFGTFSVIARADVAQWMVDAIAAPIHSQPREPMIGWW
jgi:uncharacterized protein YbjT (DUF2867 family)